MASVKMMHLPLRIFGLYLIAISFSSNQVEKTRFRVPDGTVVLTVILIKSHWNSMLVMYSVLIPPNSSLGHAKARTCSCPEKHV